MTVVLYPAADTGIAREQALLAAGRPAVLLWRAQAPALVVPEALARRAAVRSLAGDLASAGWPLLTRSSGGGAVAQGSFTLNVAMALPVARAFSVADGYDLICGAMIEALKRFEVPAQTGPVAGAFCDGAWNVTVAGRKLAGTAQRWRSSSSGRTALCHAALLLDMPADTVWPALAALHAAAGLPGAPDPAAHVSLGAIIPKSMRVAAFAGALARAAEDRLSCALAAGRRAA